MKAVVIHEAGGPEVLKIEDRPIPRPQRGKVLIRNEDPKNELPSDALEITFWQVLQQIKTLYCRELSRVGLMTDADVYRGNGCPNVPVNCHRSNFITCVQPNSDGGNPKANTSRVKSASGEQPRRATYHDIWFGLYIGE